MNSPEKSRREMLDEWKEQKSLKPAPGLSNITNKPGTTHAIAAMKPSVSFADLPEPEKENPTPLTKSHRPLEEAPTPVSLRKPALSGPAREQMEQKLDLLQGKLHSIKRDSRRPSISGGQPRPAQPASSTGELDDPSGGGEVAIDIVAAKLQSLKRDSVRPSFGGGATQQVQFEAAGQFDLHALSRAAQQLFGDKEFAALCDKGMNAQLTRSKDGATEESKIKELANMVKLLRRAMKEIQQRTQMFIDHSVRYEREASQQMEGMKLSGESVAMAAQAELANIRREAATAAANHKSALATWQSEIDMHRAEVATLRREMERVEGERDRAREEVRRAEVARSALDAEVKEARKSQAQRERELQVDKNSAAQQVYEVKETAERQRAQLSEELAAALARAEAAEATCASLKEELEAAEAKGIDLTATLEAATAERDAREAEVESLSAQLAEAQAELVSQRKELERLLGEGAATLSELEEWQTKASDLLAELERERTAAAEQQAAAEAAAQTAASERTAWEAAKIEYEAAVASTTERENALSEEKAQLKAALAGALEQRSELEATGNAAQEKLAAMEAKVQALTSERDQLADNAERLQSEVSAAQGRAEAADAEAARVSREASDKACRLAQLEGELEALQECTMGLEGGDQRELLSRMVSKIASLESAVASAEARRREAHNQLVELKGNIRVFCRLRPHPRAVAAASPDGSSVRVLADNKEHAFSFDRVFKAEASQAAIFDEVSDVVQSALDGYKVCLFSYGQTGAGKTHTMQGGQGPGQEGIIPRAITKILATVERLRDQGWEYSLEASYIEVYNEQLRDLLADNSGPGRREAGRITENNAIQHAPNGGHTIVLGATRLAVTSEYEAADLVRRAANARAVESTAMNAVSSRSHSVFMLYITGRHEASGTFLQGSLNLVDLAGSERLARSGAEGQRAREACSINKSLSSLGDVFAALAAKQTHIPYRNSKLTHLLQPCLGGSGKTLMFVNINPEPESTGESLCSLRFAAKVNACETAAKGGASRNVSSMENNTSGGGGGFGGGGGSLDTTGRPSMTGRPSIAPMSAAARRQSMAPGAATGASGGGTGGDRRMSMIPSSTRITGVKRPGAMGPPPPPSASRVARPKFNN